MRLIKKNLFMLLSHEIASKTDNDCRGKDHYYEYDQKTGVSIFDSFNLT